MKPGSKNHPRSRMDKRKIGNLAHPVLLLTATVHTPHKDCLESLPQSSWRGHSPMSVYKYEDFSRKLKGVSIVCPDILKGRIKVSSIELKIYIKVKYISVQRTMENWVELEVTWKRNTWIMLGTLPPFLPLRLSLFNFGVWAWGGFGTLGRKDIYCFD